MRSVRIFTAQPDPDPIPDIEVTVAFRADPPRAVMALVDAIAVAPPDWLVVQFNQFSYGRWGFNPFLPMAIRAIKRRCPDTRVALIAHEDFVPVTSWKFAVMTTWQRAQFIALGRLADLLFFSIEPWAQKYAQWFPHAPVHHLPVGSNIGKFPGGRDAARASLGLEETTFVAGVFGSVGPSRLVPLIRAAAAVLSQASRDFSLLYVGSEGAALREALPGIPVRDAGRLPPDDVARHITAMDIHLCPFLDGVSTRRGSFMAGLQQGVPSVTNVGENTDRVLRAAAGNAFVAVSEANPAAYAEAALRLYREPAARLAVGRAGEALYESTFTFDHAGRRLFEAMVQETYPAATNKGS